MSGGSMNYLYCRVENDATFEQSTPLRRAFKAHLTKVAKALHEIEWADSGDTSPGDHDEAAIAACLAPGAELAQLTTEAREAHKALGDALAAQSE